MTGTATDRPNAGGDPKRSAIQQGLCYLQAGDSTALLGSLLVQTEAVKQNFKKKKKRAWKHEKDHWWDLEKENFHSKNEVSQVSCMQIKTLPRDINYRDCL